MEVDAGEAGLNAMRRALAEVEKKEVPPRAAPTDIGAPKGVAVKVICTMLGGEGAKLSPPAQPPPACNCSWGGVWPPPPSM